MVFFFQNRIREDKEKKMIEIKLLHSRFAIRYLIPLVAAQAELEGTPGNSVSVAVKLQLVFLSKVVLSQIVLTKFSVEAVCFVIVDGDKFPIYMRACVFGCGIFPSERRKP